MRVEFLGTGGYHPNERRHTACVMLPEIGLVFDAGTSAFRIPARLQTDELQIFLSHAHLDHVMGLTFLLGAQLSGTLSRVRVYGTPGVLEAVEHHLLDRRLFPVKPPLEYTPLEAEVDVPLGGKLTHFPLVHPGGSTGYRIDWPDRSLAYVTDTTTDGSHGDFVRGVDVLIHECYFPDSEAAFATQTGHSHTTPVATLARDAGVGRLILVHIDPQNVSNDPIDIARARAIFPKTEVADDLLVIEL
jgi:ribonuclease Z